MAWRAQPDGSNKKMAIAFIAGDEVHAQFDDSSAPTLISSITVQEFTEAFPEKRCRQTRKVKGKAVEATSDKAKAPGASSNSGPWEGVTADGERMHLARFLQCYNQK